MAAKTYLTDVIRLKKVNIVVASAEAHLKANLTVSALNRVFYRFPNVIGEPKNGVPDVKQEFENLQLREDLTETYAWILELIKAEKPKLSEAFEKTLTTSNLQNLSCHVMQDSIEIFVTIMQSRKAVTGLDSRMFTLCPVTIRVTHRNVVRRTWS